MSLENRQLWADRDTARARIGRAQISVRGFNIPVVPGWRTGAGAKRTCQIRTMQGYSQRKILEDRAVHKMKNMTMAPTSVVCVDQLSPFQMPLSKLTA